MITIDNNTYNVGIIKITRKASQKIENLGTTLNLRKHYDIKGTYYDYEIQVATQHMNVADYDSLYEILTAPQESHTVTMPYGQTTITFDARVSVASDVLVNSYTTFKKWGTLKITIEALTPQKEA